MAKYVELQLLVDPKTAEEIQKKGIVEIAQRRADKKFKPFVYARLKDNVSPEALEKAEQALSHTADRFSPGEIQKFMKKINLADKLNDAENAAKKIQNTLSGLSKMAKHLAGLEVVDVALAVADIAVDVAGFIVISQKLKGVTVQLNSIAGELSGVKDINVENLRRECEKLVLNYNTIADKIKNVQRVPTEELETYLIQVKTLLSQFIRLMTKRTANGNTLLNMIYLLLPAYTSVLCMFLRAYYFEHRTTPTNYGSFLEVFQELNKSSFREAAQDSFMLEKGCSYRDAIIGLNALLCSVFEERLEIEDQMALIEVFETDEAYLAFEKQLDAAVERAVREHGEEIASQCGEYAEECRRALCGTA